MGILNRLQHGWNAFINNRDPTIYTHDIGGSYSYKPDRPRLTRGNERSIITSIFNKIALDASSIDIRHCQLDKEGRFESYINSSLDDCLTVEANIDQTGFAFKQDIFLSLLDEGVIAIVPVETDLDPTNTGSFSIESMRVGKIVYWYPEHVLVNLYNEKTGRRENVKLPKKMVTIVESPLYAVINEPNSMVQRLIRKLVLLDAIDEQSGSGKLDLIIQLPYVIKSEARKQQAERRRKEIEMQLTGSKYGIAYTDGTERITQLNRPVENNLMKQIEFLTSMVYSQLGITQAVMDGSADEKTMLNYFDRTVAPLLTAVVSGMRRTFLTKHARTKGQSIMYFRDPFKLLPLGELAEAGDKLIRNEILSANEIRTGIGFKPAKDPKADELRNPNMPQEDPKALPAPKTEDKTEVTEPGDTEKS